MEACWGQSFKIRNKYFVFFKDAVCDVTRAPKKKILIAYISVQGVSVVLRIAPRCLSPPLMLCECTRGCILLCAHVCVCVQVCVCARVHWCVSLNLFSFFFQFYIYYVRQQMNHLYYGEI